MPKDLVALKQTRGQHKATVTRNQKHVEGLSVEQLDPEAVFQLKARLEMLAVAYHKFYEVQSKIEALIEGEPASLKEEEQQRDAFEEAYYRTVAKMQMFINTAESKQLHPPKVEQTQSSQGSRLNLPIIDLPTFDGKFHNWIAFRDSFKSLIDEKDHLTKIEKLHYLKASLKGAAASLLDSLDIAENNYQIAWETLSDRFENKRLLAHHHIKALMEFPVNRKDVLSNLRRLVDELKRNTFHLSKLGLDTTNWDPLLLYIANEKVDEDTRKEWGSKTRNKEFPTLQEFYEFITSRCEHLEEIKEQGQNNATSSTGMHRKPVISRLATTEATKQQPATQPKRYSCPHCSAQHQLFRCPKLLDMPTSQRQKVIKGLKLCFNCLGPHHKVTDCASGGCKKCGNKHNTLLHTSTQEPFHKEQPILVASVTASQSSQQEQILLSTAIVHVQGNDGVRHSARVLLDSGSQGNFVTKEFLDRLQVSPRPFDQLVQGISQINLNTHGRVELTIKSSINRYQTKTNFLVIGKLSNKLPQSPLDISKGRFPERINLADPTFATPGKIDMLIGAPLFWDLLCVGRIKLSNTGIALRKTKLGWIVTGTVSIRQGAPSYHLSCNFVSLADRIEKFWSVEEVARPSSASFEPEFERQFTQTLIRRADGRFQVGLPVNSNVNQLGNSFNNAKRRLMSLERRLMKMPQMQQQYREFMDEYQRLGHMTKLADVGANQGPVYYLPHHGIVKEKSITSSLRVVFDGSAKTTTGISLNDTLMRGSLLQSELFSILLRFRRHSIVITSDIEKMYRQIYIAPADRDLQRILWRRSVEEPIGVYQLNTVTYGTKAGSFLAIRCLEEVAKRIKNEHPEVSRIISQDFYVDDLLTGGESVEEVERWRAILTHTLGQYGFNLRKWNSNHADIVQEIRRDQTEIKHLVIEDDVSKTLGLMWNAQRDTLGYAVRDGCRREYTKRAVISSIAQIFDPLGLIGPVTVLAKILMQDIWKKHLDWDESLPGTLCERWLEFQTNWQYIKHIEIPRHVMVREATAVILHGFCDASESAYGACVYISSLNQSGEHAVRLLCAKSKVAPLKVLTLPRLELCGAVLLSKLVNKIQETMGTIVSSTYLWTDSKIVLAWISKTPDHWQTFVANRVAEIRRITDTCTWRHVIGKDNPADIISRGMNANRLRTSQLWWTGPAWLKSQESEWPQNECCISGELLEARTSRTALICTIATKGDILYKYSSFRRLVRIVAYIHRFRYNCGNSNKKRSGALTPKELEGALFTIIRLIQAEAFSLEIKMIKSNASIPKNSKLLSLNPFIDDKGILRVGGRIKQSEIAYEEKHQMILPGSHFLTHLIIKDAHHQQLHAGIQALLCRLRLRFWIIGAKNAINGVLRKCTTCIKISPKSYEHQMGDLPKDRITPAFPFQICGVDYAGPLEIRVSHLRNSKIIKAYICIFVCFVTKAVHMELTLNLTTESFIKALKRFMARRGKPSKIYSDNGATFLGAKNKLSQSTEVAEFMSGEEIIWELIPPRSPHFGGLWEAAVKSAKYHLKRTIGAAILTYEEFYTILTQVESCLNSRPLSPISSDPNDLTPLTPSHFLIGRHAQSITEANLLDLKTNRLQRYQLITKIIQDFWSRWSKEYLHNLQQRSKWQRPIREQPKEGDLVIIREQGLPPFHWKVGRVKKIHPGPDGAVRVIDIKTASGTITRSVQHVCKLPIQ